MTVIGPSPGSNSAYQGGCRCASCRSSHAMELRIWRCRQWIKNVYWPQVAERAGKRLAEIEAEMRDQNAGV